MIRLGKLQIDPIEYGSQGNAILGIRDSGKSYTGTYLAERLFESGIPFTSFDPVGIWRYLRIPGKGRGYPIVVAGGKDGDLPLTVASAPEIVRAAMREGVSLVIDLFDIDLSKADWRRIVTASIRVMLHENQAYGLRHVFLEEAAEFVPQKVTDGVTYAEIEKLARMGGNSRLGYTLINQRSQEIAKAVLELCENVFLHRQRGKNSLENMDKWLNVAGSAQQKEIMAALPDMPQGQCYAWIGGDNPRPPMLIKVPTKNSLHPDRRVMRGDQIAGAKPPVDVGSFVTSMRSGLAKFEEEAKANDPKLLRAVIANLKRQLTQQGNTGNPVDAEAIRAEAFLSGAAKVRSALAHVAAPISNYAAMIREAAEKMNSALNELHRVSDPPEGSPYHYNAPTVSIALESTARGFRNFAKQSDLPKGEQAVLIACAQYPRGVTRRQLTVLTGYKRSTRDAYILRLRDRQCIEDDGDRIMATPTGVAALGPSYQPLPTGDALRAHILPLLPEGERIILKFLINSYPRRVERGTLDNATGFKRSTRDAYLNRLSARELVDCDRNGVTASEMLFG